MKPIQLLPDWMYHAIEESLTCQFTSVTKNGTPVALPVFLNHFDPDTGTLIISSPVTMKRVENVRQHPEVAMLFSPGGVGKGEPGEASDRARCLLMGQKCRVSTGSPAFASIKQNY